MEDEKIDVVDESSTSEVEESESSTDEQEQTEQVVETTTLKDGTLSDKPVPYDRHKEVIDERNYERQQKEFLQNQLVQKPVQTQEEVDPYAQYTDPQTKLFYQDQDKRMMKIANKIADERAAPLVRQNEILTHQLASIQHEQFKDKNTDVVQGSQEETKIAQLVSTGVMTLDQATWAIMGPKRAANAAVQKQQKQTKKTAMKAEANLATGGLPAQSGLPSEKKQTFMDEMTEQLDKNWDGNIR